MTLTYYRHGHGDVGIIVAHSWVASSVAFAPLLPSLDGDKYSWVFPSFTGYGDADSAVERADIAAMGRDLVALADDLGWNEFHLMGHSMGGQAVQSAISDELVASRVASVTLISSVPKTGFPVEGEDRQFFEAAAADPAVMEQVVLNLATGEGPHRLVPSYISALSRATSSAQTLNAYLRAWTQDDVSDGVDQYNGPVLAVAGKDDPALGSAVAAEIASSFANSRIEVIAGAGHFPPLEQPVELARLITEHVAETERGRGRAESGSTSDERLVEAARRAFTGYEANDYSLLVDQMDPAFEFEMSDSLPYGGVFVGPAEFLAWRDRVLSKWDYFNYDAHEIISTPTSLVVPVKTEARSRTGIEMKNEHLFLFGVRDGVLTSCRLYADTARGRDVIIDGVAPRKFERP